MLSMAVWLLHICEVILIWRWNNMLFFTMNQNLWSKCIKEERRNFENLWVETDTEVIASILLQLVIVLGHSTFCSRSFELTVLHLWQRSVSLQINHYISTQVYTYEKKWVKQHFKKIETVLVICLHISKQMFIHPLNQAFFTQRG